LGLILKGIQNKVIASNKINEFSSRSHSILTLKLETISKDNLEESITSTMNIVDLAGSERLSQSGSEART
jgi:hypothetical protein